MKDKLKEEGYDKEEEHFKKVEQEQIRLWKAKMEAQRKAKEQDSAAEGQS